MKQVAIALLAATLAACMHDQEESSDETSLLQLARTAKQSKRLQTPSDTDEDTDEDTMHFVHRFQKILEFLDGHEGADIASASRCGEQMLDDLGGDYSAGATPSMVASWDECLDLAEKSIGIADGLGASETVPHSESLLSANSSIPGPRPDRHGHTNMLPTYCETRFDGLPDHPCNCAVQTERRNLYFGWTLNAIMMPEWASHYLSYAVRMMSCGAFCHTEAEWRPRGSVTAGSSAEDSWGYTVGTGITVTSGYSRELSTSVESSGGLEYKGMGASMSVSQTETVSNYMEQSFEQTYESSRGASQTRVFNAAGTLYQVRTRTMDTCGRTITTWAPEYTVMPSLMDRPRCLIGHCHSLDDYCCTCDDEANVLTEVAECRPQSCPPTTTTWSINNHALHLRLSDALDHGDEDDLDCGQSNGGYIGTITVRCEDGDLVVVSDTCHPRAGGGSRWAVSRP